MIGRLLGVLFWDNAARFEFWGGYYAFLIGRTFWCDVWGIVEMFLLFMLVGDLLLLLIDMIEFEETVSESRETALLFRSSFRLIIFWASVIWLYHIAGVLGVLGLATYPDSLLKVGVSSINEVGLFAPGIRLALDWRVSESEEGALLLRASHLYS